jgi:hypothetical protein
MTCESVCWVNIFAIALSRASPCPVCEGVRGGGEGRAVMRVVLNATRASEPRKPNAGHEPP